MYVVDIFGYDCDFVSIVFVWIFEIVCVIKVIDENIIGMNIVNNNGVVVYQFVFYFYFYFIFCYSDKDDFWMIFKDNVKKYDEIDYICLQNVIKIELVNQEVFYGKVYL